MLANVMDISGIEDLDVVYALPIQHEWDERAALEEAPYQHFDFLPAPPAPLLPRTTSTSSVGAETFRSITTVSDHPFAPVGQNSRYYLYQYLSRIVGMEEARLRDADFAEPEERITVFGVNVPAARAGTRIRELSTTFRMHPVAIEDLAAGTPQSIWLDPPQDLELKQGNTLWFGLGSRPRGNDLRMIPKGITAESIKALEGFLQFNEDLSDLKLGLMPLLKASVPESWEGQTQVDLKLNEDNINIQAIRTCDGGSMVPLWFPDPATYLFKHSDEVFMSCFSMSKLVRLRKVRWLGHVVPSLAQSALHCSSHF